MTRVFCNEFDESAFSQLNRKITLTFRQRTKGKVRDRGNVLLKLIFSLPEKSLPGVVFRLKLRIFLKEIKNLIQGGSNEKLLSQYGVQPSHVKAFMGDIFSTESALSILGELFDDYKEAISRLDNAFLETFQKGLNQLAIEKTKTDSILQKISGSPFFKIEYDKIHFPLDLNLQDYMSPFGISAKEAKIFPTHPKIVRQWNAVKDNVDHGPKSIYRINAPFFIFVLQKGSKSFIPVMESNHVLAGKRTRPFHLSNETKEKLSHVERKLLELYKASLDPSYESWLGSPLYLKPMKDVVSKEFLTPGTINNLLSKIASGQISIELGLLLEQLLDQLIALSKYCKILIWSDPKSVASFKMNDERIRDFFKNVQEPIVELRAQFFCSPFLTGSPALFFVTLVGSVNLKKLALISTYLYKQPLSSLISHPPEIEVYDKTGKLLRGKLQDKELVLEHALGLDLLFPADWIRSDLEDFFVSRKRVPIDRKIRKDYFFMQYLEEIESKIWTWKK